MQVRSGGKWEEGEFLPQLENEKNNVLVSKGILENRQPMYREIASEDGSMNSILKVRSTYPKCRHPECLEVKIGCLEPARFHSSQLLQYLTRTTTKWPAGTTDVGRGVGVAIGRTSSTRGSGGDAGHGGDRGVEGVGMRVTSGGATRIWNKQRQTFQRWFFILTPKIGEMIPSDLRMFFFSLGWVETTS